MTFKRGIEVPHRDVVPEFAALAIRQVSNPLCIDAIVKLFGDFDRRLLAPQSRLATFAVKLPEWFRLVFVVMSLLLYSARREKL